MRRGSYFVAFAAFAVTGAALLLAPGMATAKRTPWNAEEVAALGSQLAEQAEQLEAAVRAVSAGARPASPAGSATSAPTSPHRSCR